MSIFNYYKKTHCGCQDGIFKYLPIPYGITFTASCLKHDNAYHKGGTSDDRHTADRELFANMMKRTYQVEYRPLRMWWMTTVAFCYYGAVRLFGRFYFRKSK